MSKFIYNPNWQYRARWSWLMQKYSIQAWSNQAQKWFHICWATKDELPRFEGL